MIEASPSHKTIDTLVSVEGLPDEIFRAERMLKVVQLMVRQEGDEIPVLITGPAADQHGNLAVRYFMRHGIPFEINAENLPKRESRQYQIIGAGYISVDPRVQICAFHGGSLAYNVGINKEHIERVADQIQLPEGWEIMIDQ